MTKFQGTVAITGAGSGLGQGIATECARRGYKVLALIQNEGQRAELLAATAGLTGPIDIQILDVTRPGDFTFPDDLDLLVNNAGIRLKNLPIEEIPLDEWRLYFEVNFFGAVELTRRAIPIMRERHRGTICNINSGSIIVPVPFLGPYRATKGAMAAFSESLRVEVAPFGIRVIEILPTAVRTGMNKDSVTKNIAQAVEYPPYAPMARRQRELNAAANHPVAEIADAARHIVDALHDDKGLMRHGSSPQADGFIDLWRPKGGEPQIAAFINSLLG